MATIQDLISSVRASIASNEARADRHQRDIDAVRTECMASVRDPSELEAQTVRAAQSALVPIDSELTVLRGRLAELETELSRDEAAGRLSREFHPAAPRPEYSEHSMSRAVIGSEPRTYHERSQHRFLTDLFRCQLLGEPGSGERLLRHQREMEVDGRGMSQRDITSGNAGAFLPPQYMLDMWAELAREGRPFGNICTSAPLPATGTTFHVPRVSTGSSVDPQVTENATISEADLDETTLSVNLCTIAGHVDIARQALDRSEVFEQLVFSDLCADYAAKLDNQLLNGTGVNGQHVGVRTVASINTATYTSGSPVVSALWPILAQAVSSIASNRHAGPSHWVLHPRRWSWMLAALDTTGRPLVSPSGNGPHNAAGISANPEGFGTGVGGTLMGIPVVLDSNIVTNAGAGTEDVIVLVQARDLILLEDNAGAPVTLRYEAGGSAQLNVRLLAFGYSAFASGRQPKSICVIGGTGLIAPW